MSLWSAGSSVLGAPKRRLTSSAFGGQGSATPWRPARGAGAGRWRRPDRRGLGGERGAGGSGLPPRLGAARPPRLRERHRPLDRHGHPGPHGPRVAVAREPEEEGGHADEPAHVRSIGAGPRRPRRGDRRTMAIRTGGSAPWPSSSTTRSRARSGRSACHDPVTRSRSTAAVPPSTATRTSATCGPSCCPTSSGAPSCITGSRSATSRTSRTSATFGTSTSTAARTGCSCPPTWRGRRRPRSPTPTRPRSTPTPPR